jgi:hypothetical protein
MGSLGSASGAAVEGRGQLGVGQRTVVVKTFAYFGWTSSHKRKGN